MVTYLLIGNPEAGKEGGMIRHDYQNSYRETRRRDGPGYADDYWTMKNHGSNPGEQVVLLRTGRENPGLIGFGLRIQGPWRNSSPGGQREYPVRFYNLVSLSAKPCIGREKLQQHGFWRKGNFPGSGTILTAEELDSLEKCCEAELQISLSRLCSEPYALVPLVAHKSQISGAAVVGATARQVSVSGVAEKSNSPIAAPVSPQMFVSQSEFAISDQSWPELWEGGKTTVLVNRYERDPRARKACIDIYGPICSVCRFDFSEKYGPVGQGYIHVHHLKMLSELGRRYRVNPRDDLRPICPNCHEMIHTKDPPLTIEELRYILR